MARLSGGKNPRLDCQRSRTEYILAGKSPNRSEICFSHLGYVESQAHRSSGKHMVDLCQSMEEKLS